MKYASILAGCIMGISVMFIHTTLYAQDDSDYGEIISISENIVTVHFGQRDISIGDLISFIRSKDIIDPITGKVWGVTGTEVAKGIVEDLGLDKAYVTLKWQSPRIENIALTDVAFYVPQENKFKRMSRVVAKVQELISDNEIEIDVGSDDEVNEGDMFLIERSEMVYDPETNEVTGTKQVEIGRGQVTMVDNNTSRGELVLNPGIEIDLEKDNIVFEPLYGEIAETAAPVDSSVVDELRREIDELKNEIEVLRATVDSLGGEHLNTTAGFATMKTDLENMIRQLMVDDTNITLKYSEPQPPVDLVSQYKQTLETCLNHDFKRAIPAFQSIMEDYPDSHFSENCRYWIGQSYFTMRTYEQALVWFQSVIEDSRFLHKDDDASLMLGITHYQMGAREEALREFIDFVVKYPDSEYLGRVRYWIQYLS